MTWCCRFTCLLHACLAAAFTGGLASGCNRTSAIDVADRENTADSGAFPEEVDANVPGLGRWVTVRGSVSGLRGNIALSLEDAAGAVVERVDVTSNGSFEFTEPIPAGETYRVEVSQQPEEGYCIVLDGEGVAHSHVQDVEVKCSADNPGLAAIEATIGTLSPVFDPATTRYRLDLFGWVSHVGINPVLADNNARVYLDAEEYRGEPFSVAVAPGQTTVELDVELPSGQRKLFTVDIHRPTRVVEDTYGKATYPTDGAQFGYAMALNSEPGASGETVLALGAPGHPSAAQGINGAQTSLGASLSGAVLLYSRDANGRWEEGPFIKAANAESGDLFGLSVAFEGDLLVVGAPEEDGDSGGVNGTDNNDALGSGAVYVFRYRDDEWRQEAYLKAEFPTAGDGFGRSVSLHNRSGEPTRVAIGAWHDSNSAVGTNPEQRDTTLTNSGAAYVFEYRNGWEQVSYLKPSNTDFADSFGEAVAIDNDTLVVGAPLESGGVGKINGDQANNDTFAAGAAYVFEFDGGNDAWYQRAYLKAHNAASAQRFGNVVALQADTVVVGAFTESNLGTGVDPDVAVELAPESGAVYVFERREEEWSQQAYLKASNTDERDRFGHAVALSGETLVIGAPLESSAASLLTSDSSNNDALGAGAAYVFFRQGDTWRFEEYLKASNPEAGDNFGAAVAFDGKHVVVGAPYEDGKVSGTNREGGPNNASIASGAFYVFR